MSIRGCKGNHLSLVSPSVCSVPSVAKCIFSCPEGIPLGLSWKRIDMKKLQLSLFLVLIITIAGLINQAPTLSYAQAVRLKFTTPARSATSDNPSPYIQVEAWDVSNTTDLAFNDTVVLASSSSAGYFSVSRENWQDTSIITLSGGTGVIYYRDSSAGDPVITASRSGLSDDTQVGSIVAQSVSRVSSYIVLNNYNITADGASPCTVTIVINDTYGYPISGKQVTIFTFRGSSQTTVNQSFSVTDANGQATGTIASNNFGIDTISAIADGETIVRGFSLEGCEGVWHFDADLKDNSGRSYDAANYGGLWVSGAFGSAVQYNGVSSYAQCDSSALLDTEMSVEVWAYPYAPPPSGTNSSQIVGKFGDAFGGKGPWHLTQWSDLGNNIGQMEVKYGNDFLVFGAQDFTEPLPLNVWNHLVGVYDSDGEFKVYLNGVERGNKAGSGVLGDIDTKKLRFSNYYDPGVDEGGVFNGIIDEVKIYGRALSVEEVSSLYSQTCIVKFISVSNSLKFVSSQFEMTEGNPSTLIAVEARDPANQKIDAFNDTVMLVSSSNSSSFSVSNVIWNNTSVITFASGVGQFYYKDFQTGNPIITVFRADFVPDIQMETIVEPSIHADSSYIMANPWWVRATGRDSVTCTVTINDTYGYPISGLQVTLYTVRGKDTDAVSAGLQVTDSDGKCSYTISSKVPGWDTVTAFCENNPIENMYFLDDFIQAETLPRNWDLVDGSWTVGSQELAGTGTGGRVFMHSGDWSNCIFSAKVKADALLAPALLFRVQDADNYYRLIVDGSQALRFSKFVSGIENPLGEKNISFPSGTWHMFKLEISGYTFSCYLNGTLELAAADPGASFSSGKIGLQSGNQTYFDDVISYPGRKGFKFIPVATRLEIVSSPQTLAAGVASEPYSIEARYVVDTEDYVDTYCFDTMSISSSSLTGRFSADGISWSSANESPAALAYGQAEFYYRDLAAGTHTITVSRSGLIPDTQQAVVIDISETSSFLRVNTPAILADGTDNCTVVVTVQDSSGSPFPDQSVLFQTSRGAGYDSVSANPQTTDANGQCTFTVKSVYAGADTFTAVCKGIVILENILNNPSFELGIADPDNWIFSGDSWTWVSQESYSGSRAISGFTQASGDNYALATWAGLAPSDRYPVSPAGNYSASQMCRTDLSSGYAAIRLVWYNGSDTVGDADYAQVSGINTWTFQSALVTSPADANYVSYRSENRGAGTVWFDACMLRRVPTVNFNPTRLVIVTPQRTASVQEPTGIITVEAQDNAGIKDASFTGSTAGLSTSSAGGKFSFSCTYWEDVDHVSITDGSGSFYYKDIIEDSPVITVYRAGLAPDTQTVGVGPPVVSETASFFTINSGKIPADGKTPCTLTFYIKDKYGNALPGLQVTIFTARGSPPDTVAQPDLTDINGQCTATVISSNFGEDTFTGLCDGKVITLNLVSNPSMEEGTTSPEGWILNPNAATAALVRDTTVFTAGGASARISVTAVPSATSVIFYQQNLMLDRGIAYGVSFYAKCSKDKTGTADLTQQDTGANCGLDQNFSMGTSWDYYSFSFIASGSFIGDNINDACLKISTSQDISETITWWIDDVKFVRLPFANFTASRLVIDSPQRTAGAGIISDSITVEARDAAGARDTTFNNIFDLSSSFFSGRFSANRYTWIDTSIIRFSNGFAAFYYRDTSPGSPTITISSQGMQQDSQVFSVTQSAVCETTSYFRVYESRINADGITPCAVTVVISDINGNVIAGKEVTILTSRGTGIDSVTQPGLTDNNGQCTGFIVSLTLGPDTITAVCDGTTITENILNNPSFEQNFEGETMPSWWDFVGDNPGSHTGTWTWTQNEVYSGKRVMAHSCAAPADNYLQAQWSKPYRPAYPVYPVTPSTSFLVSQYAKTDLSSDMAGIRIIW